MGRLSAPEEKGKSREETRYPLESSYVPWGSVIFVLCFSSDRGLRGRTCRHSEMRFNVQKGYAARRLVQPQPGPTGLEIQSAQDIGFRMSGGLDVVLERASKSGAFSRPVEEFVAVCGKDPVEENGMA